MNFPKAGLPRRQLRGRPKLPRRPPRSRSFSCWLRPVGRTEPAGRAVPASWPSPVGWLEPAGLSERFFEEGAPGWENLALRWQLPGWLKLARSPNASRLATAFQRLTPSFQSHLWRFLRQRWSGDLRLLEDFRFLGPWKTSEEAPIGAIMTLIGSGVLLGLCTLDHFPGMGCSTIPTCASGRGVCSP